MWQGEISFTETKRVLPRYWRSRIWGDNGLVPKQRHAHDAPQKTKLSSLTPQKGRWPPDQDTGELGVPQETHVQPPTPPKLLTSTFLKKALTRLMCVGFLKLLSKKKFLLCDTHEIFIIQYLIDRSVIEGVLFCIYNGAYWMNVSPLASVSVSVSVSTLASASILLSSLGLIFSFGLGLSFGLRFRLSISFSLDPGISLGLGLLFISISVSASVSASVSVAVLLSIPVLVSVLVSVLILISISVLDSVLASVSVTVSPLFSFVVSVSVLILISISVLVSASILVLVSSFLNVCCWFGLKFF